MVIEGVGALAAVEVGGGGCATVVFHPDGRHTALEGAHQPPGASLALAVPGLIDGGRVVAASNLGWFDADPVAELGLAGPALLVCNDAEAAALGEAALRDPGSPVDLVYVGLGTGVGGAVVVDGVVTAANLLGHASGFGEAECRCGAIGCLETVAAGWALPRHLDDADVTAVAAAAARAIAGEPLATPRLVVAGGGLVRRHPALVHELARCLHTRVVEPSAAPAGTKSAAAWGLQHLVAAETARP